MAINGTLDYGKIPTRGGERDRGTGYINAGMESFEMAGVGTVVKLEPTNVTMHGWELVGKGCSVRRCTWLAPEDSVTPAQVARAFFLHNAEYHNEEHINHVVYLWRRPNPDDPGRQDGTVWSQ